MAARIREIARATEGKFKAGEIRGELVKSRNISPPPATQKEKERWNKQISNELRDMASAGELERVKKGVYRQAGVLEENKQASVPLAEEEADTARLRILRTIPKPLPMRLPLGLEKYVLIYPGDFIVVAGATNSGKTGWFLNLVWLNWDLFPVTYLTSELTEVRLSIRLHNFCEAHGTSLDDWERHVVFKPRDSKFAKALNPAGINIVDYLEIYKDFQEVGLPIKEVFKRQQGQPGVTFVGLQMKPGNKLGRGGALAMEKPFLYLAMDYFKDVDLNRLVIRKAKDPARDDVNPNGMDFWFRIEKGCKFIPVEKPKNADSLVAKARKEANGMK